LGLSARVSLVHGPRLVLSRNRDPRSIGAHGLCGTSRAPQVQLIRARPGGRVLRHSGDPDPA
jgi:hypothetical protein